MLGEALTAEDDAAVLQELEALEGEEAKEEAAQLPTPPKVPAPTELLYACDNSAKSCKHGLGSNDIHSGCMQRSLS